MELPSRRNGVVCELHGCRGRPAAAGWAGCRPSSSDATDQHPCVTDWTAVLQRVSAAELLRGVRGRGCGRGLRATNLEPGRWGQRERHCCRCGDATGSLGYDARREGECDCALARWRRCDRWRADLAAVGAGHGSSVQGPGRTRRCSAAVGRWRCCGDGSAGLCEPICGPWVCDTR
jgi:hypothetical protein